MIHHGSGLMQSLIYPKRGSSIMVIVKSKSILLFFLFVLVAIFVLETRQLIYLGLSNAANIHFSRDIFLPIGEPRNMPHSGTYYTELIEKLAFPLSSELLRLRGLAESSPGETSTGLEDLILSADQGNILAVNNLAEAYASSGGLDTGCQTI